FRFSNMQGVQSKMLRLSLTFRPASRDSMVAAYVPADASTVGFAFRVPSAADNFRVIYRDRDTGAVIWENAAATPRVFLAPEIRTASSWQEALADLKDIPDLTRTVLVDSNSQAQADPARGQPAGSLQEFHLAPNEIRIKYSANLPGILTVADSYSKGWRAEVNGKEEPVVRVNGVFRGVRLAAPG